MRRKIIPLQGKSLNFDDLSKLNLGDKVALKFCDYEFEELLRELYDNIINYKRNHANELFNDN